MYKLAPIKVAILGALIIIFFVYCLWHPYLNGVAYTHQQQRESIALLEIARQVLERGRSGLPEEEQGTIWEIVDAAPKPADIDDSWFNVKMKWDLVAADQFQVGDVDKTIVMFPDLIPSQIDDPMTPLLVHVSSSFTKSNENCVLVVVATAEVPVFHLNDVELKSLLGCRSGNDAANWLREYQPY